MSELRHDPISRRWVNIASERGGRPMDFTPEREAPIAGAFCPFCEGHEDKTPPEILALRPAGGTPDGPGWAVRVIPNKYPALMIEGNLDRKGTGIYDTMRGIGAHEVIVEGPSHDLVIPDMTDSQVTALVRVCADRVRDLMRDRRFKYILLFKNHLASAGASLAHPHTQIIATPVTPRAVAVKLESAKAHHQFKERCLFCDLIQQEIEDGSRIVSIDDHFITLAPFASRSPFELFLAPRKHSHSIIETAPDEQAAFARALKETLARLRRALKDPPYNLVLHTAPNTETLPRRSHYWDTLPFDFHWHIEILPRLTKMAGFEWGTGFFITPTPPEEAAAFLRDASGP
jgi:UDPglucose--hexose-1-phosphate uridylyltransferase